jgi:excinuclease ABC subunit A
LELIKSADYIIDLGPEGGQKGGQIIACGTPEDLINNKTSTTGDYLIKVLN